MIRTVYKVLLVATFAAAVATFTTFGNSISGLVFFPIWGLIAVGIADLGKSWVVDTILVAIGIAALALVSQAISLVAFPHAIAFALAAEILGYIWLQDPAKERLAVILLIVMIAITTVGVMWVDGIGYFAAPVADAILIVVAYILVAESYRYLIPLEGAVLAVKYAVGVYQLNTGYLGLNTASFHDIMWRSSLVFVIAILLSLKAWGDREKVA